MNFSLCFLIGACLGLTSCVHADPQGPATTLGSTPETLRLPGEIQTVGSEGPLFVRADCEPESERPSGDERPPQIELGLSFRRPNSWTSRPLVIPFAGFRCGTH